MFSPSSAKIRASDKDLPYVVIYPVRVDYRIGFVKVNKSFRYELIKKNPERNWTGIYNSKADYLNKYIICTTKIFVNDEIGH